MTPKQELETIMPRARYEAILAARPKLAAQYAARMVEIERIEAELAKQAR